MNLAKKRGHFPLSKIFFVKTGTFFKIKQLEKFFRDIFLKSRTIPENPGRL
jgi:hypothetical protein